MSNEWKRWPNNSKKQNITWEHLKKKIESDGIRISSTLCTCLSVSETESKKTVIFSQSIWNCCKVQRCPYVMIGSVKKQTCHLLHILTWWHPPNLEYFFSDFWFGFFNCTIKWIFFVFLYFDSYLSFSFIQQKQTVIFFLLFVKGKIKVVLNSGLVLQVLVQRSRTQKKLIIYWSEIGQCFSLN